MIDNMSFIFGLLLTYFAYNMLTKVYNAYNNLLQKLNDIQLTFAGINHQMAKMNDEAHHLNTMVSEFMTKADVLMYTTQINQVADAVGKVAPVINDTVDFIKEKLNGGANNNGAHDWYKPIAPLYNYKMPTYKPYNVSPICVVNKKSINEEEADEENKDEKKDEFDPMMPIKTLHPQHQAIPPQCLDSKCNVYI